MKHNQVGNLSRAMAALGIFLLAGLVSGCANNSASPFTLYRNSSIDMTLRIHYATFDAVDTSASYNLNNCQMAARLLNANLRAFNKMEPDTPQTVGFWCEPGPYKEHGMVPTTFQAQYPTDA